MEYKFYRFTENTSWDEETTFLNYQADVGWRVIAVVVPGADGVLLLGREKNGQLAQGNESEP